MNDEVLLHAFFKHAPSGRALAFAYHNPEDFSYASKFTDRPTFEDLVNRHQDPSNFAYITMAGLPYPNGDAPLIEWTPINRLTNTVSANRRLDVDRGARRLAQERSEIAEAAAIRSDVRSERRDTTDSALLRDVARWRPADTAIPDDTANTPTSVRLNNSAKLTDDEIFAGGLELLNNNSNLLQVAGTHRHQEILDKINAGYPQPIISRQQLQYKIGKALDMQSRLENRPRAEIKAELEQARKNSGVTHRTYLEIAGRGKATRAARKQKEVGSPPKTLETFGIRKIAPTSGIVTFEELESDDDDDDNPLGDLEEMGRRVMKGSLSRSVDGSEDKLTPVEQQVLKDFQEMSKEGGTPKVPKRKPYDYDRDGDTTDEETRAEQISRFERGKIEARKAASKGSR